VAEYEPWHRNRLACIPGITGLWQVSGRSDLSFPEMLHLDLEYVSQRSLWLDVKIVLKTLPAMLSHRGAY
jgi:lipopolysaccharide/colanic/teichoic acid biosynthesis glycosyltransferase